MNRYLSSKNTVTIALLWSIVLVMVFLLILGIRKEHVDLLPIIILSLVISMIVWILLDTRYVIKNHNLLYRSGPFRGRIDIQKIQKIKKFSGMLPPVTMKPALDSNGFIITYDKYNDVFVSPKKSEIFINELLKINPNIEFSMQ